MIFLFSFDRLLHERSGGNRRSLADFAQGEGLREKEGRTSDEAGIRKGVKKEARLLSRGLSRAFAFFDSRRRCRERLKEGDTVRR